MTIKHWVLRVLATSFLSTAGLATGIQNAYVGNNGNGTIEVYASTGVSSVFANVSGVQGIAIDSAGNIFASSGNTIYEYTPGGVQSTFSSGGLLSTVLTGFVIDGAGNVYVADYSNSTIIKITSGGSQSVFATANLSGPGQMAFDSAGNLFVSNRNNAKIVKITPGGTDTVFGSVTGLNIGLAIDSSDNVYAVDRSNNIIQKFTPAGTSSTFATGGLLNAPKNIAFDALGNLYVVNSGTPSILIFTPGGTGSVFSTTGLNSPYGIVLVPTPEPASWMMFALGLVALLTRSAFADRLKRGKAL